jgi:dihydrofolate reductase
MARLTYTSILSLDGYVADASGNFDWAAPDEEVHAYVNELERPAGTYLYGRRMYDVMRYWENANTLPDRTSVFADYTRIWQSADKVVFSTTLEAATTTRTRLERTFDPEAIRRMKATAGRDISIGGPQLAAQAIKAGLVDDYHLFVSPVIIGGGTRALPDGARLALELVAERRFRNGVVHLHYRGVA